MKTTPSTSTYLAFIACFLISCSTPENPGRFNVQHAGVLKNMMQKGDITAKADLDSLRNRQNLYALGALENLKGEILIMNSQPYISYVDEGQLIVDGNFDHKATLLVTATVSKWKTVTIPEEITSHDELEAYIESAAKENGIDVHAPFPFLLAGKPSSFDWHVINWKEGDTEHSHEKHVTSGPHGVLTNQEIEILGFYSDSHHAVFTHHTTNMHMHFLLDDGSNAGHVDDILLGQGMKLMLPVES